jgi:hypothetical protein
MRDSTTAADIPVHGTELVAGYGNGAYAWTAADWARFPDARHVAIDVNGSDPGGCGVLDVETGDATVAEAVTWVHRRTAAAPGSYVPVIYCNRSTLTPLFNAMNAAGLKIVTHFRLWVATLDGIEILADMTGVTAVQARGANLTGGHYDESIVYDDAWHPGPAAPPPPPPPAELDGQVVWWSGGALHNRGVISADAGRTWS